MRIMEFLKEEDGVGVIEVVLILVGNMVAAAYAEHCRRQWNG